VHAALLLDHGECVGRQVGPERPHEGGHQQREHQHGIQAGLDVDPSPPCKPGHGSGERRERDADDQQARRVAVEHHERDGRRHPPQGGDEADGQQRLPAPGHVRGRQAHRRSLPAR
jgi:hypothetical protein